MPSIKFTCCANSTISVLLRHLEEKEDKVVFVYFSSFFFYLFVFHS